MLILTLIYMKYLRKDEEKITKMEEKSRRDGWETGGKETFLFLAVLFHIWTVTSYLCIYINCKSFWPALYGSWWICCIQKIKDPVVVTRMHSPNRTAWKWQQRIVFCLICILEYHWVQETRGIRRELKAAANCCHLWNTGTWQTSRRRSVKQREHRLSGVSGTHEVWVQQTWRDGQNQVMGDFGCKTWHAQHGFPWGNEYVAGHVSRENLNVAPLFYYCLYINAMFSSFWQTWLRMS